MSKQDSLEVFKNRDDEMFYIRWKGSKKVLGDWVPEKIDKAFWSTLREGIEGPFGVSYYERSDATEELKLFEKLFEEHGITSA